MAVLSGSTTFLTDFTPAVGDFLVSALTIADVNLIAKLPGMSGYTLVGRIPLVKLKFCLM